MTDAAGQRPLDCGLRRPTEAANFSDRPCPAQHSTKRPHLGAIRPRRFVSLQDYESSPCSAAAACSGRGHIKQQRWHQACHTSLRPHAPLSAPQHCAAQSAHTAAVSCGCCTLHTDSLRCCRRRQQPLSGASRALAGTTAGPEQRRRQASRPSPQPVHLKHKALEGLGPTLCPCLCLAAQLSFPRACCRLTFRPSSGGKLNSAPPTAGSLSSSSRRRSSRS